VKVDLVDLAADRSLSNPAQKLGGGLASLETCVFNEQTDRYSCASHDRWEAVDISCRVIHT
jgi:hypothetical protein